MAKQKLKGEATEDVAYVVPSRVDYKKNRIDRGLPWDLVYGNKKCFVCRQPMAEGDVYVASLKIVHKRSIMMVRHYGCDPLNPPKRTRAPKAIDAIEDGEVDDTRTIYMDNRPSIGDTVDIDDFGWTVIEHGEDEEGTYIIIEKLEGEMDE